MVTKVLLYLFEFNLCAVAFLIGAWYTASFIADPKIGNIFFCFGVSFMLGAALGFTRLQAVEATILSGDAPHEQ